MYFYTIYTSNTWSMLIINNSTLISIYLPYNKHIIDIYHDIILSALLLDSRPMTSCHLTSYVTMVTCFSIIQEIKKNQKKI